MGAGYRFTLDQFGFSCLRGGVFVSLPLAMHVGYPLSLHGSDVSTVSLHPNGWAGVPGGLYAVILVTASESPPR